MFSWTAVLAAQERCQDMRREADRYRLVRQALAGRRTPYPFHYRAMNWLGRWLVAWGYRLQERYGATGTGPTLQTASCGR
jgi:hypothetical protein